MTFEEAAECIRNWRSLVGESPPEFDACLYSTDAKTFTVWFMDAEQEYFEECMSTPRQYDQRKEYYLMANEVTP